MYQLLACFEGSFETSVMAYKIQNALFPLPLEPLSYVDKVRKEAVFVCEKKISAE